MSTTGSKFLFGSAALALVAAFFVSLATVGQAIGMDQLVGPLSLGYKGPVGNHVAYSILVGWAAVAILIGTVLSVTRDGDPDLAAARQGRTTPVPVLPPRGTNYWPAVAAGRVAMIVLGLVYSSPLFIIGLITIGVAGLQWGVYAWSDLATADPFSNRKVRHELVYPLDFPLFAMVAIALFVFSISRLLLALPEGADTAVFGAVPATVFVVAIVLNARKATSRRLITILAVLGFIAVVAIGVAGLVMGPETVEKHENEPSPYKVPEAFFAVDVSHAPFEVVLPGEEIR